ncbi:MAG: cytidylate kinase-like family protein [Sedimentisphaerales bacterium]|nr:cytidylate kinase-like family protein [Sedimentisphaerales bacterium]
MVGKGIQNREIHQIIERQMRQWELSRQEQAQHAKQTFLLDSGGKAIDYIAVSRQLGSYGEQIARILAELLGWQLYDKEILDAMAEDMNVHQDVLESVDERIIGWIEDWLAPIFTERSVGQLSYYRHLAKVLLVIAEHGRAVIVGRAAGLLLPRDRGLSVRVFAPLEMRARRYAEEHGTSIKEAKSILEKSDRGQQKFVQDMLKKDIFECCHYDIVINTEKLNPTSVAKLIWRTLDQRQASD